MLSASEYITLIEKAKENHENGMPRFGFGKPKASPVTKTDLTILDITEVDTPKEIRRKLVKYFAHHKKELQDPFSFPSYLLDELRATDKDYANKWNYFVPKPIVMYMHSENMPLLYRGMKTKNIYTVFLQGEIRALDTNPEDCIEEYTASTSMLAFGNTGYYGISTTTDFAVAKDYAQPNMDDVHINAGKGYVLIFDYNLMAQDGITAGIDINETLKAQGYKASKKKEIKFPLKKIRGKYIVGAVDCSDDGSGNGPRNQYIANPNYAGTLLTQNTTSAVLQAIRNQEQQAIAQKSAVLQFRNENALGEIINLIKKKTQNNQWQFGEGGRSSKIKIDGVEYFVPAGIKKIYHIAIIQNTKLTYEEKLLKIHEVANQRKKQHISFFGFGERQPLTRYTYDKIADIAKSQQIPTHAKPSNLFSSHCALHA